MVPHRYVRLPNSCVLNFVLTWNVTYDLHLFTLKPGDMEAIQRTENAVRWVGSLSQGRRDAFTLRSDDDGASETGQVADWHPRRPSNLPHWKLSSRRGLFLHDQAAAAVYNFRIQRCLGRIPYEWSPEDPL